MILSGATVLNLRKTLRLYSPTSSQRPVHESPHQFNVVRFGRQSGKSTFGNNKILDKTWRKPDSRHWYIAPTYRLANQMYERAMFSLTRGSNAALRDKSDTELMIKLLSGGRIYYLSGHDFGGLPGETLDGAIIDECREQKKELWTRVIMPMLGTTNGWCDFLSTPNGFDWFYDMDQKSKVSPQWGSFHSPSTNCPFWTHEMIQEARENMNEDLFAQEIMAEFRDMGSGSCYVSFGSHNVDGISPFAVGDEKISKHLPILVGLDFNLNPMSWALGQHRARDFHWHDEIYLERTHTEEAAKVLVERVKGHKPGVILIGDASGKAGQRAAAAGQSDYDVVKQVLKSNGIPFTDRTPDSNPPIKDRVNTVNATCRSADGSIHMTISPKCKYLIKDLQRRAWKVGAANLAFDNSDHTVGHMSDAVGYPVCVLAPIKAVGSGVKMHIINRTI